MISYEIMHYLKRTTGKERVMPMKLDVSKTDKIEWGYLEAVLKRMGFASDLVELNIECISTVSYKIVDGGKEIGPIMPSRGFRQGDQVSPYLIILCAKGFSVLIRRYEPNGLINGCKVAREAPIISHMLFADDSYLYCRATERETYQVLNLLRGYEQASGQHIKLEKSSIFFSKNTDETVRGDVSTLLGI